VSRARAHTNTHTHTHARARGVLMCVCRRECHCLTRIARTGSNNETELTGRGGGGEDAAVLQYEALSCHCAGAPE